MSISTVTTVDPWTEAFNILDPEDKKRLDEPNTSLLDVLQSVSLHVVRVSFPTLTNSR